MKKYEVGDTVKLRTGGPDMLVHQLIWDPMNNKYKDDYIFCTWFDGRELVKDTFSTKNLELVSAFADDSSKE